MATNGRLYSCSQNVKAVLPIIPPTENTKVSSVCQELKLPFLDTATVPPMAVDNICPTFREPAFILQTLTNFHRKDDICRGINKDIARTLLTYFENKQLLRQRDSLENLKQLPLFETHQGEFTSLTGKAVYQWPDDMCSDGDEIWLGKISNVVFLDSRGTWSELKLNTEVVKIHPTEIYCQFVFPKFGDMNESTRYKHLHHIFKNERTCPRNESQQFIKNLKDLPCIGNKHPLKTIYEFYDHENIIFCTFKEKFMFLPEYYFRRHFNDWKSNPLLEELGFHFKITQAEFLDLCEEMASKQHIHNTREKSSVLFNHLFKGDTQEWYSDCTFLSRVVNIPFVLADRCKQFTWIAKTPPEIHVDGTCEVWPASRRWLRKPWLKISIGATKQDCNILSCIRQCSLSGRYGQRCFGFRGSERKEAWLRGRIKRATRQCRPRSEDVPVYLTNLKGACVNDDVSLVWSVKPVYRAPQHSINPEDILSRLGLNYKATVSDVLQHLITISETGRADPRLFDTYTAPVPGIHDIRLINVIGKYFEFLNKKADADVEILKMTPCIPVSASGDDRTKIVLVKPSQALMTERAKAFFPYLHRVPYELMASTQLLERIGVKDSIQLSHIQLVLSTIHNQLNGAKIDPNTRKIICLAISHLQLLLPTSSGKELSPLYLPGRDNCLHHTSKLVYPDSYSYKDCKLPQSTDFILFNYPDLQKDQFDLANQFCPLLPEEVRPRTMSALCHQQILKECANCSEDIEMAKCLKIALRLEQLPNVCISTFKKYAKHSIRLDNIKDLLSPFFQRVQVVTVEDLEVELAMKNSTSSVIGTAKVEFYLSTADSSNFCLYLDSNITRMVEEHIHKTMVQELLGAINNIIGASTPGIVVPEVHEAFCLFLKSKTNEELHDACQISGIEIEDADFVSTLQPQLGQPIPKEWHYMLDQNPDNIFHSQEIVGYETTEGIFVFAQILYAIPPGDQDSINPLLSRYMIALPDKKITVTALDIYKFVRKRINNLATAHTDEQIEEGVREEEKFTDAAEAKKHLCQQLKQIRKMNEPERSRAIRRLYLRWHPDKNLDNVELANEVFVFLKKQIERLEQGLDPEVIEEDEVDAESSSPQWKERYSAWEETVNSHSRYRSRHEQYFRSRSNWGGVGSGMAGGSWPTPKPNVSEGRRWFLQAEYDFMAVEALYEKAVASNNNLFSHVYFMAHEVAEKAVKGGVYAVCGLSEEYLKDHKINTLSRMLRGERMDLAADLPSLTATLPLERYYLGTRFPNRCPPGRVPSDLFTIADAEQAHENAKNILTIVQSILHTC